jgi:hypothetical protein
MAPRIEEEGRLFRRIALVALALGALSGPGTAPAGAAPLDLEPPVPGMALSYSGPIGVFNLYWSSSWNPADRAAIDDGTRAIASSDYTAGAAQYGVPGFTWAGSEVSAGRCGNPGTTVWTLDIMQLLRCLEQQGTIPAAGGGAWNFGTATMIYNVIVPATTTVTQYPTGPVSCVHPGGFNGYHWFTPSAFRFSPLRGIGRPILFTVIPTQCDHPNGFTPIISHELIEAATDPIPTQYWIDESHMPVPAAGRPSLSNLAGFLSQPNLTALLSLGEAGDVCSALYPGDVQESFTHVGYAGIKMGAYWSNADHACVVGTKRVVYNEFEATGSSPPYRLDLNGVSGPANVKVALPEGTHYRFTHDYPGTEYRYVYSGDCEGVVTFPAGNDTANASMPKHSCAAKIQDLIRFDARGVPSGTSWHVTVDGVDHTGYTTVFADYGASVSFAYGAISGCTLTGTSTASPYVVTNPTTITATYECGPPPLPSCSTYADAVRWSHPTAYWRLGDINTYTAHDSGPFGLDGYIEWSDEPGIVEGIPGALVGDSDTAMQFAGNGIRMPDVPALDIGGTAVSVEIWARGQYQSPYGYLISKSDWSGNVGYSLYTGPSNTLRFFVGTGTAQITTDTGFTWDNSWHHIVGTYDGSSVRLYVDGVLLADTPASGSIASSSGIKLVVARFNNGGFPFYGFLDEVAVYDHALTPDEVQTHYAVGTGGWFCA